MPGAFRLRGGTHKGSIAVLAAEKSRCDGMVRMRLGKIRLGCETLIKEPPAWFGARRLGLLANQASVTSSLESVVEAVAGAGGRLSCLFSPQHGFYSEKQANMKESSDGWNSFLKVPVFSLYGSVRQPTPEMMERMDVLLIDLQDVGARVYTYSVTMGLCLEAAAKAGVKVVVLDRPNPLGGRRVEGNIVKEDHRSFVGRYPIPMRHGLTMGEIARYISKKCGIDCDLEVIRMEGWKRRRHFPQTGLQWVFPSPNMPCWESALTYPGMVLLEGTNVSEGRGTTLPFQVFGAPFLRRDELKDRLEGEDLEGVVFRPISFQPAFDKWASLDCQGFQIHVTDKEKFRPYRLGLVLLKWLHRLHGKEFEWLPPPYEYEWEKLPIDILLGEGGLRERIEAGAEARELEAGWQAELDEYREDIEDCLLYRD